MSEVPKYSPDPLDPVDPSDLPIEDVLPSFEMHNYMFNRTFSDVEATRSSEKPPDYDSATSESSITRQHSERETDPSRNADVLVLNNLDQLQKIDLPLDVKITLTKKPPRLSEPSETESPLREYQPGDLITGYVTVKSRSKEVIPFEMFLVSLEGAVGTARGSHGTDKKEPHRHVVLRTYDLAACFHPSDIELGSHGCVHCSYRDKLDGSHYGFSCDKEIMPGETYKKFFTFIVPRFLLDTACCYQIPEHLHVPPSFGMESQPGQPSAAEIAIDPLHGYGRSGQRGAPIKVLDLSGTGQYVSYSVTIQLIGARLDFYKKFYRRETTHTYDLIFLKDVRHYVRLRTSGIPCHLDGDLSLRSVSTAKQLKRFDNQVCALVKQLKEMLSQREDNRLRISGSDISTADIADHEGSGSATTVGSSPSSAAVPLDTRSLSDSEFKQLIQRSVDEFTGVGESEKSAKGSSGSPVGELQYSAHASASYSRGIFSHAAAGLLEVNASAPKWLAMKSVFPSNFIATPHRQGSSVSLAASMVGSERTSEPSLFDEQTGRTGTTESTSGKEHHNPSIHIDVEYIPKEVSMKHHPPAEITVRPRMRVINIQSDYSLPVSIDDEFIFSSDFTEAGVRLLKKKYLLWYMSILELSRKLDAPVPKNLYYGILALNKLQCEHMDIEGFFESFTERNVQWKFNVESRSYHASFDVPLKASAEVREKKYYIPPSFQSCQLGRFYQAVVDVGPKRHSTELVLPLRVE
ncbi:DEKNAAC105059 [Brettanomyces naardenensis]|uniref:DEKNAAC105059 n=1 Tax=Brettanomyces naardenensis TaxID=13370 RepID=A0A448YSA0_BRENA|nr:DEKNAAC105059 [Brettanomyces naardenensis]